MSCQGFKEWWTGKGEEWPVRPNVKNFHAEAWWYANNRKTGPFETIRLLAALSPLKSQRYIEECKTA